MELVEQESADVQLRRNGIMALEKIMLSMPQVEIPITHTFADGMYARTAFIKKGTAMTGAIHLQETLQIMVSGRVSVATDREDARELSGFNIMVSPPGTKRAGVALEDTIWVTIIRTDETNPEAIVAKLTTNDYAHLATHDTAQLNNQEER